MTAGDRVGFCVIIVLLLAVLSLWLLCWNEIVTYTPTSILMWCSWVCMVIVLIASTVATIAGLVYTVYGLITEEANAGS